MCNFTRVIPCVTWIHLIYTHTHTHIYKSNNEPNEWKSKEWWTKGSFKKKPSLVIGKEASVASYLGISEEG